MPVPPVDHCGFVSLGSRPAQQPVGRGPTGPQLGYRGRFVPGLPLAHPLDQPQLRHLLTFPVHGRYRRTPLSARPPSRPA